MNKKTTGSFTEPVVLIIIRVSEQTFYLRFLSTKPRQKPTSSPQRMKIQEFDDDDDLYWGAGVSMPQKN